jgi:cell migration-inducing and hyaluronan-binding protein
MKVEVSERWTPEDRDIYFVTNYTDHREAFDVTTKYGDRKEGEKIEVQTLDDFLNDNNKICGANAFNGNYGKEFEFVINGKDSTRNKLLFEGLRCKEGKCPEIEDNDGIPLEDKYRKWSDPASWGGKLPKAGESVEIEATWNMLLDIPNPPALDSLVINGRLTFQDEMDITLKAKNIWVQAGQLYIGTADAPFTHNAKIELLGMTEDDTVQGIDAGNKVLVNTGKVKMYGMNRQSKSRLLETVKKGDNTAKVDSGLQWKKGDKLYFAPTAMQATHSDYLTIDSYDNAKGDLILTENFQFYHWGKDLAPTENEYNGLDMRGEVYLLSRNVVIEGEDVDSWGCSILTTEIKAQNNKQLAGSLFWNNVEVSNCSQKDTLHSAVRFEGVTTGTSEINNSSVHGGLAWLLYITSSKNINVKNTSFIGARAVGVNLHSITNVHLNGVFVGDVQRRDYVSNLDGAVDKEACFAFCSYWGGNKCPSSSIKNSIAAGCPYGGFVAPGHNCDNYN